MNDVNKITLQQQLERQRLIENATKKSIFENYARIQAAKEKARAAHQREVEKRNILLREAMANEQIRSSKLQEDLLKQSKTVEDRKIKAVQRTEFSNSNAQGQTAGMPYRRQNAKAQEEKKQEFKFIDVDAKIEEIKRNMHKKYEEEGKQKLDSMMAELNARVDEIERQRKIKEYDRLVKNNEIKEDTKVNTQSTEKKIAESKKNSTETIRRVSQPARRKKTRKIEKPRLTLKQRLFNRAKGLSEKLDAARKVLGETPKNEIRKTDKKLEKVKRNIREKNVNVGMRASKIERNLSKISVSVNRIMAQAMKKAKKEQALRQKKKREQRKIPQQSAYTKPLHPTDNFEKNRSRINHKTYGAIQSYRNNMKFYNDNKYILEERRRARRNLQMLNDGVVYDKPITTKQQFRNRVRSTNIDHERAIREYRERKQQRQQRDPYFRERYI